MKATIAATALAEAEGAADALADQLCGAGGEPRAVVLFAAPTLDHAALLRRLRSRMPGALLVGASSAGEFANDQLGEGMATALGVAGDGFEVRASAGRGISVDARAASEQLVGGFLGIDDLRPGYRNALVMTDALAGHTDRLLDELTLATAGLYQFFGGGAGDNAQFQRTAVFLGEEVLTDAAVALEIVSDKPIGVGVSHGWEPASPPLRVTAADGLKLVSLNGLPAAEAFQAHAQQTGQALDPAAPIPFFLHNILGIETGGSFRLRVPLAIQSDGSVVCAAEIPPHALVRVMRSTQGSTVEAAEAAANAALAAIGEHRPQAALFFDCVATRLRMGQAFSRELAAVQDRLSGVDLMGCNTHGQIARAEGQFGGFHNCTAVVCVLPA
jgi:hypothetical protein